MVQIGPRKTDAECAQEAVAKAYRGDLRILHNMRVHLQLLERLSDEQFVYRIALYSGAQKDDLRAWLKELDKNPLPEEPIDVLI